MAKQRLEHDKKAVFIKKVLALTNTLNSGQELAELIWKYGNDCWSEGYARGIRGYKASMKLEKLEQK